jgi:hypothetical protein
MRHTLLTAALLAMMTPGLGQAADADAEKNVTKLSGQITDALVKGDTAFLDEVMADDWVMISPDGAFEDKAIHLREIKAGTVKYESMEKSGLKARVYGDAAIVTGQIKSRLKIKGQVLGGTLSFTEVFVNRGGNWRSVSVQLTRIASQTQKP